MSAPENPPAFPYDEVRKDDLGDWTLQHPGMTLRDWFAGQALAGRMADGFTGVDDASVNARVAYKMADAMLAQREGV